MKGYKIVTFKRKPVQVRCSDIVYNTGQLYKQDAPPVATVSGFHFYRKLWHVYECFPEVCWLRLLAVRSKGDVDMYGKVMSTNVLYVARELPPAKVLDTLQHEYANETAGNRCCIRFYVKKLFLSISQTPYDCLTQAERADVKDVSKHRQLWRQAFKDNNSELMLDVLR